jgi:hypothetical protein
MRILLVALSLALIGSAEAQAQVITQPGGPALCAVRALSYGGAPYEATGSTGCYRFDGVAGDRVRVRLVVTSGSLSPAATTSCGTTTLDDSTCVLATTGRHGITVSGTGSGTYAISIQRLNDPVGCGGTVSYGTVGTLGQLGAAGDSECHRFTAAAGDRVRVTASGQPVTEIVRPDGTTLCVSAGRLTCTVDVPGQHTLLVRGAPPGGYGVSIQRLNDPVGCTPLSANAGPAIATLFAPGVTRCYRLDGQPGTQLRVRVVSAANPATEVLRPNGTDVCGPSHADDVTCSLDVAGPHTIVVAGPTGDFAIEAQRLDAPAGCANRSFGTLPATDSLTAADSDCHRFSATAGDAIRVHIRSTSALDPFTEVASPDGLVRCTPGTADHFTCTTQHTGLHTILVRDGGPGTRSGGYQVAVQRLNDPAGCTSASFGTAPWNVALAAGQTFCTRFDGTSGDIVRARAVTADAAILLTEVIAPDGTSRCGPDGGAALASCRLNATGRHTLLIRDASGARSALVAATLQRLNDPVGCLTVTSGSPAVVGSVAPAEVDCWRVDGDAGDRLRIRTTDRSGDWEPFFELRRPNGRLLGGQGASDATWDLLDTGTHTILVYDDSSGLATGSYDLRVTG